MGKYEYLTRMRDKQTEGQWNQADEGQPSAFRAPAPKPVQIAGAKIQMPLRPKEDELQTAYKDEEAVPDRHVNTTKEAADGDYVSIMKKYMPEPDREAAERAAKRRRMGALAQDVANTIGDIVLTSGAKGGWMVGKRPTATAEANDRYDQMMMQQDALYRDYRGRLANAAIKDMEARRAADALRKKQEYTAAKDADTSRREWYKAGNTANYQNGKLRIEAGKLGVAKDNAQTAKVNARTRQGMLAEQKRSNQEREAIAKAKNSNGGAKTFLLADNNGRARHLDVPRSVVGHMNGAMVGIIKSNIRNSKMPAVDKQQAIDEIDNLIANYSGPDKTSVFEAIVQRYGTIYPGLYEEASKLLYNGYPDGDPTDRSGGGEDDLDLGIDYD